MDFMSIGSVNNYVRTMDMQQKWQSKKSRGDYKADGAKSVTEWAEAQKKKAEDSANGGNNKNDEKLRSIHNKMSLGTKLTPAEKQYLQAKDPQSYQKLRNIEAEQEQYERELKRCRTKERVQKLKLSRAAASLSTVNAVKNDPHITAEKKLEIISGEQRKMTAIEKSTEEFVKSGRYAQLPTEAEKQEAEKLLKEAEEEKSRPDSKEEVSSEIKTVRYETEKKLRAKARGERDSFEKADGKSSEEKARKAERLVREAETVKPSSVKLKKSKAAERTAKRAKAENSASVRKVRRAKITPIGGKGCTAAVPAEVTPSLDTKA